MTITIDGIEQLAGGTVGGDLIIKGDLTVQGTTTSVVNQTISGTVTIDLDDAEALLVRKDGDAGDIFTVDTVNDRIGVGGAPEARLNVIQAVDSNIGGLRVVNTGNTRTCVVWVDVSNVVHIDSGAIGVGSIILNGAGGSVSIGTTTVTTGQLTVDQPSLTGAIPVLYLDQADVSEEMFEFATTIGTGNAIEAIAAKTLTTTHFIKVTIPGGLTRYLPVGTIA